MRTSWRKLFIPTTLLCALTFAGAYTAYNHRKENPVATFVITETGKYTSLDPLDGDSSQNLPVARMIYATPVEINVDNTLVSSILDSYSYDSQTKVIRWIVRNDLKYSDGSKISVEDVAFSVARMAYTRPNFPLIKLIKGLTSWLQYPNPLKSFPEGIKVDGNTITIELMQDYPHPMFRFCLELFGVIPKACVNLETNKIQCASIPTSGYYEITSDGNNEIQFRRRGGSSNLIHGKHYPNIIKFVYKSIQEAFAKDAVTDEGTVILSNESKFTREELKEIQSRLHVGFTPAAWFTILQLNPDIKPFDHADCRLVFAERFRQVYQKLSGEKSIEASVFTKIITGYMEHLELQVSTTRPKEHTKCLEDLRNAPAVPWGFDKATASPLFVEAIKLTSQELEIKLTEPIQIKDRKDETDKFIGGKSAIMYGRTGFWALDPSGDIQMLFTPNLHKGLQHYWDDANLQALLGKVVQDGQVDVATFKRINQYLYENAKFNVYSHIRRFYSSTNKNLVQTLPIGITSPAPWHLFGEQL